MNFFCLLPLGGEGGHAGPDEGALAAASRKHAIMAGSPLISQQGAGPLTYGFPAAGKPFHPEGLTSMRTFGIRSACGFRLGGGVPDAPAGGDELPPTLPVCGSL